MQSNTEDEVKTTFVINSIEANEQKIMIVVTQLDIIIKKQPVMKRIRIVKEQIREQRIVVYFTIIGDENIDH